MKKKNAAAVLILFLIVSIGGYIYYNNVKAKEERHREIVNTIDVDGIYKGISINGIDLSGLGSDEAKNKLETYVNESLNRQIKIKYGDKEKSFSLKNLGATFNYDDALDRAINYAREGTEEERYEAVKALSTKPMNIECKFTVEQSMLNTAVDLIASETDTEPQNATVEFTDGGLNIIEAHDGAKLNKEKLRNDLEEAVNKNTVREIIADIEYTKPEKTDDEYSRVNGVIGQFTTDLGNGTKGRNSNVALSTKLMSDRVIMPGELISFNKTMGDITRANGYQMASTIVDGEYVDSLGGGLCQTSSTLYNALVRADVEIVERHPHSIPAPYVPIGEDGAVWQGGKDLKFRNNWDFPIVIKGWVADNKVTFQIYGDKNKKDYEVEMYSVITEKITAGRIVIDNPELPPGEEKIVKRGRNGYRVQSFKVYKKDGKVIKEVPYMKSSYPKRDTKVEVGRGDGGGSEGNDANNDTIDLFQ